MRPRKLISVSHSYAVALNRRLAHELALAGRDNWEVTALAPSFFQGDLRPLYLQHLPGEPGRLVALPAYLTRFIHVFFYGARLRAVLKEGWDLVHCWEEPYILAGPQVAWWTQERTPLV